MDENRKIGNLQLYPSAPYPDKPPSALPSGLSYRDIHLPTGHL